MRWCIESGDVSSSQRVRTLIATRGFGGEGRSCIVSTSVCCAYCHCRSQARHLARQWTITTTTAAAAASRGHHPGSGFHVGLGNCRNSHAGQLQRRGDVVRSGGLWPDPSHDGFRRRLHRRLFAARRLPPDPGWRRTRSSPSDPRLMITDNGAFGGNLGLVGRLYNPSRMIACSARTAISTSTRVR